MPKAKQLSIDVIGKRLLKQLETKGWKVSVETDYAGDHKEFYASKKTGPLDAFRFLGVILFALAYNPLDVEIRFQLYADPKIVGPNKRPFGSKVRKNNFEALRSFCEELMKDCGINAREQETMISPKCDRLIKFGRSRSYPSYVVEMVYWKQPKA